MCTGLLCRGGEHEYRLTKYLLSNYEEVGNIVNTFQVLIFQAIPMYGNADSRSIHRNKRFTSFQSPAGMSLTKLPMGRTNSVMTSLFPPRESLVVTSRLGTGNSRTFFLRSTVFNVLSAFNAINYLGEKI
jgi:hypothetical protein